MKCLLKLLIPFSLIVCLLACSKEKNVAAVEKEVPEIVSSVPADGVQNLETESLVVRLTFNMDMTVVMNEVGKVSAGTATVLNVSAKETVVSVFLNGLQNGGTYTLHIPEGVLKGSSGACAEEIVMTFSRSYHYDYAPSVLLSNEKSAFLTTVTFDYLRQVSGRKMVSGVWNHGPNSNDFLELVSTISGKVPAISGYDCYNIYRYPADISDVSVISKPLQHNRAKGLIASKWTWKVPATESAWKAGVENSVYDGYFADASFVRFSLERALVRGNWENDFLMEDIAKVAGFLKLMQRQGIVVLWQPLYRPVPDEGQSLFWWSREGAELYKSLWKLLHDQLSDVYGLDNLIWVWSAPSLDSELDEVMAWYPGDMYVDVVGARIFSDDNKPKTAFFQSLVDITEGRKLLAVTECGNLPDPASWIASGDRWSWFCSLPAISSDGRPSLGGEDSELNTAEYWIMILNRKETVTCDALPDIKKTAETAEMDRRIRMLHTDRDTLEKFAREQLHFAAPGDDVYIIEE